MNEKKIFLNALLGLCLTSALFAEPIASVIAADGCEWEDEPWYPTASDYVMDGLLRQLDAIETTGYGENVHEAGTRLYNLAIKVRSGVTISNNATWDGENLTINKNISNQVFPNDSTLDIAETFQGDKWTLEFCGWLSQAVGQYDTSVAYYKWGLCGINRGSKDQLVFFGGNGTGIVSFNELEFHTLSLIRDGDFCFCYIDGVLKKSFATKVSGVSPNLKQFYLYHDTVLCSYRFYNEALSSEEVKLNSIVDRKRFGF